MKKVVKRVGAMAWKELKQSEKAIKGYAVGFDDNDFDMGTSGFHIFTPNNDMGRFTIFEMKKDAEWYKKKVGNKYNSIKSVRIYINY